MTSSPIPCLPHEDELIGSLLARWAWRTAHTNATLVRSIGLHWDVWTRDLDRSLNEPITLKLASALGVDAGSVDAMTVNAFLARCGVPVQAIGFQPWITHIGVFRWTRLRYGQMFCIKCLQSADHYLRREWRLATSCVCALHGLPLLDACPYCGKPFTPYRDDELVLARCGHCAGNLTKYSVPAASSLDVELHLCIAKVWEDARLGRPASLAAMYSSLSDVAVYDQRFARAGEPWSYWRVWERAALLRSQRGWIERFAHDGSGGVQLSCPYGRAGETRVKPRGRSRKLPADPQLRAQLLLDLARRVRWPRRVRARTKR